MNKRIGPVSQHLFPSYGYCKRCQTTWNLVHGASVRFHGCTEEGRIANWKRLQSDIEPPPRHKDAMYCSSIYAICIDCWEELTPDERLPYYREQFWSNIALRLQSFARQGLELQWEEIQTHILLDLQVPL